MQEISCWRAALLRAGHRARRTGVAENGELEVAQPTVSASIEASDTVQTQEATALVTQCSGFGLRIHSMTFLNGTTRVSGKVTT